MLAMSEEEKSKSIKTCVDCEIKDGEIESLDDGIEVQVIIKPRDNHNNDMLCERCVHERTEAEEQLINESKGG